MAQVDDLEAVRTIVKALDGFSPEDQERILRWSREKIGLPIPTSSFTSTKNEGISGATTGTKASTPTGTPQRTGTDIKSFFAAKNPQRDTHVAATVAYYYRFEAPEAERAETINAEKLQDAMRLVGRARLTSPKNTLNNAVITGLLDRGSERGTFTINTVGENLVAMSLPGGTQKTKRAAGTNATAKKSKASAKSASRRRK